MKWSSICLVIALVAASLSAACPLVPSDASQREASTEYLTKLRKLHLVRPDLINYPLVVDFIC